MRQALGSKPVPFAAFTVSAPASEDFQNRVGSQLNKRPGQPSGSAALVLGLNI